LKEPLHIRPYLVKAVLLLWPFLLNAQSYNVDSLERVLQEDTISVKHALKVYKQLFLATAFVDSSAALKHIDEAIVYAESLGYDEGVLTATIWLSQAQATYGEYKQAKDTLLWVIRTSAEKEMLNVEAQALNYLGMMYDFQGKPEKSIVCYEDYMQKSLELGDSIGYSRALSNLGMAYGIQGDIPKSLSYHLKSLDLSRNIDYEFGTISAYIKLGLLYLDIDDPEKSLDYFKKASEYDLKSDYQISVKASMGEIFMHQGKYDMALTTLQESRQICEEINHIPYLSSVLLLLGDCYYLMGEHDQSMHVYREAYESNRGQGVWEQQAMLGIGKNAIQLQDLKEAENVLLQVAEETSGSDVNANNAECMRLLSELYEELDQPDKGLRYFKSYKRKQDSLNFDKRDKLISRIEVEAAYKQEKDSLAVMQRAQKVAYEAEIESRDATLRITVVGMVIVIILSIVILLFNQSNREKNAKLAIYNKAIRARNTEIHEKNKELKETNEHLERLNKSKTRFFSIISHDLRGPVANLISLNSLIKADVEERYGNDMDPEFIKMSDKLQMSASYVLNLLDTLMKWASMEEGNIPFHPELLNVKASLKENDEVFQLQAASKEISLNYELTEKAHIWADKNGLMTILRNLTSNALKFTPHGGTVNISCSVIDDQVEISIQDLGVGIAPENLPDLFEIGENKVNIGTEGEKGTGLGLNLVRDFVSMNSGQIDVQSELGRGTTFILRFKSHRIA